MNEKQIKAVAWMQQLEEYAKEKRLSMRMMDSLEECKKQMEAEDVDWDKVTLMVTELLGSIEKKTLPQKVVDDSIGNDVSMKDIEEEMRKMAERCHGENEGTLQELSVRKNGIIKNIFVQLKDIAKTKAHLKELKKESLYHQYFENIKNGYEKETMKIIGETFEGIKENHKRMLGSIRSMLSSIKSYKNGISSEKIIYEYEEKIELMNKKYQREVETFDIGVEEIGVLEQETAWKVGSIVKKAERGRKLLLWLPVIVMAVLLMAGSYKMQTDIEVKDRVEESASESGIEGDALQEAGKEIAGKLVDKAVKKISVADILKGVSSLFITLFIIMGAYFILVVLIFILIIVAYIHLVAKWCNNKICKECETYLKNEIAIFEQNNGLNDKVETVLFNLVKDYEQQYLALILNPIFADNKYAEGSQTTNRFSELKEEWNQIRYM